MAIITLFIDDTGQIGEHPRRVRIISTDNLATVTAAGYLNSSNLQGRYIAPTDIIWMWYGATVGGSGNSPDIIAPGTFNVFIPSFSTNGVITLTEENSGLPIAVNSSVLTTTSTGVPTWVGPMTNGQVIIGSTGANPVRTTITAGVGIAVTNAAGSITIATTGGGLAYTTVTGTTQAMAVNNGYVANNAGLVTLTLPATAAIGSQVEVYGLGAGGWRIAQNAGQIIHFANIATTTGVGGSVSSTGQFDAVTLTCIVADTTWTSRAGNFTIV